MGRTEEKRVVSTDDPRITDLRCLGIGEGFSTFTARFEGKPAIANSGTLNDLMNDEDKLTDAVSVLVFDTDAARHRHIEHLKQVAPTVLGVPESELPW